ncbi:hypothetical protein [Marinicella marina]|uniref:hypothetical protein n=1 Tax=Marinicella marina TaxID=2996016 RepID=UPI0024BC08F6|nr:hypothetical protein [Marinicella marina]MDJ1140445.1 hypothetical protein [Marinicella marina]
MSFFIGLCLVFFLLMLGCAFRFGFSLLAQHKQPLQLDIDFVIHAFFQGILVLILMLNFVQFFTLSNQAITMLLLLMALISCMVVLIGGLKLPFKIERPDPPTLIVTALTISCSILIFIASHSLPNMAWDSWAVWEGKADQWFYHGLSSPIETWENWINGQNLLYNQSANYPDGLSLLFFTAKLATTNAFSAIHVLYLFAFTATTLLLANRIRDWEGSLFMQVFLVLVLYTTPLISNHLMIIGYADIWIGMILAMAMIAYLDCYKFKTKGALITLVGYLTLLPMFKLEGWVWLILLLLSHALLYLYKNKTSRIALGVFAVGLLLIIVLFGINIDTPFGQFKLSSEGLTVFTLIDSELSFTDVTDLLMSGFFWQNNWSLIWLGLPFLICSYLINSHSTAERVVHVFFVSAILSFLFLFYFTEASKWAVDFTAVNRVILQLTPCYVFLLFKMLTGWQGKNGSETPATP